MGEGFGGEYWSYRNREYLGLNSIHVRFNRGSVKEENRNKTGERKKNKTHGTNDADAQSVKPERAAQSVGITSSPDLTVSPLVLPCPSPGPRAP